MRYDVRTIMGMLADTVAERDNGSFNAADTLADLHYARKAARVSDKEYEYLMLYYVYGYNGREIGDMNGTTRRAATIAITRAERKLQTVFERWNEIESEGIES